MDLFKEIKRRARILDVCNLLNIKLDRNNKCLCMFHNEKTPSFSVSPSKNIFCCFSCGKKGDVITLVSEILNLSALDAAIYLNDHLGLGIELNKNKKQNYIEKRKTNAMINRYNQQKKQKEIFDKRENKTFQILCDYLHLLWKWEEEYAPKNIEEEFYDLYVKALQEKDKVQYYIDIFIYGTDRDKVWFLKTNGKVVKEYARILGQ